MPSMHQSLTSSTHFFKPRNPKPEDWKEKETKERKIRPFLFSHPYLHFILTMITRKPALYLEVFILMLLSYKTLRASCVGSMSSVSVSYGENGPSFCGLRLEDGSHSVSCQGGDSAVVFSAPTRLSFYGLTAGDGFVCGLLMSQSQPYCWGNNVYIPMGVPQPMNPSTTYSEISAGDHHLCALRKPTKKKAFFVDCWGYNMTGSYRFEEEIMSITGGAGFNCGLFVTNGSAVCWGDEMDSGVIRLIPRNTSFLAISAGGFHVCGVMRGGGSRVVCWGRSLSLGFGEGHDESINGGNVDIVPDFPFVSVVGGRFHACGIRAVDHGVVCWGFRLENSTHVPDNMKAFAVVAGDYFTCSVVSSNDLKPVCWGFNFPSSLPIAAASPLLPPREVEGRRIWKSSLGLPVFLAELAIAVFLVSSVSLAAILYVRFKLQSCNCRVLESKTTKNLGFQNEIVKAKANFDELKIRRARLFSYEELEKATGGFSPNSQVGKGSFSCVFRGVLKDGNVVAVKRAIIASDLKNSKEFHTELDLLSRLNHAHLLNLLGYCEEGSERLLVYEFMEHGSLYELLHGKNKESLDWIRRVTIAVQAARGIEYLHGYACPPVIHRDIKSSNILIDEEWNARVADFGLSLLGPTDSSSPLSELPAGTLGYLDPEYYRLHYLTTKSDVYSFGVLLLEILSGRKAIDMQFEEGNIVEWAVPLIKTDNLEVILDARLKQPDDHEALRKIANVACKCVRMRGKERPSMDKVTTALERALAVLMGSPSIEHPILPTEVVLGSSRMHKKASFQSSKRSGSEPNLVDGDDQRSEFRAPSWITFPSVASSRRTKSSISEVDLEDKNPVGEEAKGVAGTDETKRLEVEIAPASPQEEIFLKHNF